MEIREKEGKTMKNVWYSLLLAFQFFTVLPVHKELPLKRSTITGMFACLPWIGALMGTTVAGVLYSLTQWTASSEVMLAFIRHRAVCFMDSRFTFGWL
ncbi:hypothetical protein Bsph_2446 [Lysinibacillus sphaericus C3-41]|uniref:Uncharacterized protein n=2 Tax=Lysinibacillus sphaericus TaxID=1421 RepID=B1HXM4_LYSSC|nr:hypothetical protein Bsph_2446 [Lysinibacillus sphaericus C3-41]